MISLNEKYDDIEGLVRHLRVVWGRCSSSVSYKQIQHNFIELRVWKNKKRKGECLPKLLSHLPF